MAPSVAPGRLWRQTAWASPQELDDIAFPCDEVATRALSISSLPLHTELLVNGNCRNGQSFTIGQLHLSIDEYRSYSAAEEKYNAVYQSEYEFPNSSEFQDCIQRHLDNGADINIADTRVGILSVSQ